MENMIGEAFARALEAGRSRYNALYAQARRSMPALDSAAFAEHLRGAVAPIVAAVDGVAPEKSGEVLDVLYEFSLELLGKEIWGRHPVLADGWRKLLAGLPRHLAQAPRTFAGSVTNALHNLAQTPGARPAEWIAQMHALGQKTKEVDRLLEAGKVVAWRAGLAHLRSGALQACRGLLTELSAAALGLKKAAAVAKVVEHLEANPWLLPTADEADRELRLVAKVGSFRGFGGLFLRPPKVVCVDGQFLVSDGESCWTLTADVFGATLLRTARPFPTKSEEGSFSLDARGKVSREKLSKSFSELQDSTSYASDATTLAVTVELSHAVYLVAVA